MRVKLNHFAPLLATAATAVAVAFAPIATAAPSHGAAGAGGAAAPSDPGSAAAPSDPGQAQQSCVTLGGTESQCQSPGNAQIYDAPPQVDYFPYGGGAS